MISVRNKHHRSISQLCLGAAQIGMEYGIANRTGMPEAKLATDMLLAAAKAGITLVDTARAYGQSEQRIGNARSALTVMTKLAPLEEAINIEEQVIDSIEASRSNLGLSSLPYVLLHRAEHLHTFGGAVWRQLLALQKQGIIERLGVSVTSPQEAIDALLVPQVECLQLPYNIVDCRWERAGVPALLLKKPEILVVARSALLQGVLTQEAECWPAIEPEIARDSAQQLDAWVTIFGRKGRIDLCLSYVRAQPWIDTVVVGMETLQQLQNNIELFAQSALTLPECVAIREALTELPEAFLNPALWPKRKV